MKRKCIISVLMISLLFCNPLSLINSNMVYASAETKPKYENFTMYSDFGEGGITPIIYNTDNFKYYLDEMSLNYMKYTVNIKKDANENIIDAYITDIDGVADEDELNISKTTLELISDKTALNQFLNQKYLTDTKNVYVLDGQTLFDGYLLLVETEDNVWFIPLLNNGNEQYGFKNHEVYSPQRFRKLCDPKEAKIIAYGKEVECEPCVTLGYRNISISLKNFLNIVGADNYKEEEKQISFSYKGDTYQITDFRENPTIHKDTKLEEGKYYYVDLWRGEEYCGRYKCVYENGQLVLVGWEIYGMSYELKVQIRCDRENSICYIDEKKEK